MRHDRYALYNGQTDHMVFQGINTSILYRCMVCRCMPADIQWYRNATRSSISKYKATYKEAVAENSPQFANDVMQQRKGAN